MPSRRAMPTATPFPTDQLPRLLLLGGLLGLATPAGAATLTVTSTANTTGGPNCTLRDAITAANSDTATGGCPAGSGTDTIVLSAATYTFTTPDNYWYGPNALPAISSAITVEGNGAVIERDVGAATPFRLFYISGGLTNGLAAGSLTLKNLTLRNGYAKGGNARGGGGGLGAGGAIFNQGALALDGATLTANTAEGGNTTTSGPLAFGGGGIGQDAPAGTNGGGFGGPFPCGISPCGGIGGNGSGSSGAGGGGGGFQANGSDATGTTGGAGGGSSRLGGAAAAGTVANAPGAGGAGGDGGGGGSNSNPPGVGGGGDGGGFGNGGSSSGGGVGGVGGGGVGGGGAGSNFTANGGGGGGGGFGGGGGTGVGSSNGGFGGGGGGGFGVGIGGVGGFGGGSGAFGSSSLGAGGGGAGLGGAVFSMYGPVTAVNSTVTGNLALGGAGHGGGSGHGGGLFNLDGTVTLTHVTLAGNQVQAGAGTLNGNATGGAVYSLAHANRPDGSAVTANLILTNSILAGSTDGANPVSDLIINLDQSRNNPGQTNYAGVAFTMDGTTRTNLVQSYALIGDTGGTPPRLLQTGAPIDPYADPLLGPLANNSGPTQTMALLTGSPAINAGTNAGCPATDQRGVIRPQPSGGACDLGAYEFVLTPTTATLGANPSPAVYGQTVALTATVSPNTATGTVTLQEGGSALTCAEGAQPRPLSGDSATCTVTGGFGVGPHAFTADYTSDNSYASSQGTTSLTVNPANTTTTITADDPDPSAVGGAVTVNYAVAVVAPGAGTPTGNVTVSDGTDSCIGTVAAGTCNLTFTSTGAKTLTATYAGDANFNGSSDTEDHEVLATTAQGNAGGGTVTATITGGTCVGFATGSTSFPAPPTPLPPGVAFPYGLFGFTALCPTGGTLTLTVTYPNPLPPGTQYWKYGPEPPPGDPNPHWYVLPATLAGNTAVFTITDGGLGDDDLAADGDIVDQGGPGVPGAGDGATGIPTLHEWALLVLSVLLGSFVWRMRRRFG